MVSVDLKTMGNVSPWFTGGNPRKMRTNQGKIMQMVSANLSFSTPIIG